MSCADVSPGIPCNNDTSEALFCLSANITWERPVIYQLSAVFFLYFVFRYVDVIRKKRNILHVLICRSGIYVELFKFGI